MGPRTRRLGLICCQHHQHLTTSGAQASEGVIVIAATNFPEVLDKALIRPGRFDRHVVGAQAV